MPFSPRTWIDYEDDLDAEAMNDLEARIGAIGGGSGSAVDSLVDAYDADPTGVVAADDALNAAIADFNSSTRDYLWIPAGTYRITDALTDITADGVTIQGAGYGATKITVDAGAPTANVFHVGLPGTTTFSFVCRDMRIEFDNTVTGTSGPNGYAFFMEGATYFCLQNLYIEDCDGFIRLGNAAGGAVTSSSTVDTITVGTGGYASLNVNDRIMFGGLLAGGLEADVAYYVTSLVAPDKVTVSTTAGGSHVDITLPTADGIWWVPDIARCQYGIVENVWGHYRDSGQHVIEPRYATSIYFKDVDMHPTGNNPNPANNTIGIYYAARAGLDTPSAIENIHMTGVRIWGRSTFGTGGSPGSGGAQFNLVLDASYGSILNNWFMRCEPDKASTANVYLVSTAGSHNLNDVHFDHCYLGVAEYADGGGGMCIKVTNVLPTFPGYSGATTYGIGSCVVSGGINYISLQDANTNHTPASSPTWWEVFVGATLSALNFSHNVIRYGTEAAGYGAHIDGTEPIYDTHFDNNDFQDLTAAVTKVSAIWTSYGDIKVLGNNFGVPDPANAADTNYGVHLDGTPTNVIIAHNDATKMNSGICNLSTSGNRIVVNNTA